jgi:hypothetical protein
MPFNESAGYVEVSHHNNTYCQQTIIQKSGLASGVARLHQLVSRGGIYDV